MNVSVEIHAAAVGGAVGGFVLLAGIWLDHLLARRRARRAAIERAAHDLAMSLPYVVMAASKMRPPGVDLSLGSFWWDQDQRSRTSLNEIRANATGIGMKTIQDEVQDMTARLVSAVNNAHAGTLLTKAETTQVTTAGLWRLLFPHTQTLDERVGFYQQHGYGARAPSQRTTSKLRTVWERVRRLAPRRVDP